MDKIFLYYGPKKGFEELLEKEIKEKETRTTLSVAIRKTDELIKKVTMIHKTESKPEEEDEEEKIIQIEEKIKIDIGHLISYSDEYSSVKEHAILNFDEFLSSLKINKLFLQNPPKHIADLLNNSYSEITTDEVYSYPSIDESKIYEIYSNFEKRIIGQEKVKKNC